MPMSDFDREYFLQTRREIDTEKQERDHILNFAVIVLGAMAFAVAQNDKAIEFLSSVEALSLEGSALVVLTALFWTRWKKLRQIADRWLVLHRMLEKEPDSATAGLSLESIVVGRLETRWYLQKDVVLNLALCVPVYALLVAQAWTGYSSGHLWRYWTPVGLVLIHGVGSSALLLRKHRKPWRGIQGRVTSMTSTSGDSLTPAGVSAETNVILEMFKLLCVERNTLNQHSWQLPLATFAAVGLLLNAAKDLAAVPNMGRLGLFVPVFAAALLLLYAAFLLGRFHVRREVREDVLESLEARLREIVGSKELFTVMTTERVNERARGEWTKAVFGRVPTTDLGIIVLVGSAIGLLIALAWSL